MLQTARYRMIAEKKQRGLIVYNAQQQDVRRRKGRVLSSIEDKEGIYWRWKVWKMADGECVERRKGKRSAGKLAFGLKLL